MVTESFERFSVFAHLTAQRAEDLTSAMTATGLAAYEEDLVDPLVQDLQPA